MSESRCFIHKNGFSVAVDCSTLPPEDDQPQTFMLIMQKFRMVLSSGNSPLETSKLTIQRCQTPDVSSPEQEVTLVLDRDMLDALNDADDLAKLYRLQTGNQKQGNR